MGGKILLLNFIWLEIINGPGPSYSAGDSQDYQMLSANGDNDDEEELEEEEWIPEEDFDLQEDNFDQGDSLWMGRGNGIILSVDHAIDAPNKISSRLKIFAEHFQFGRQEDAHEFLRYVIDACHNTSLRLKKLPTKGDEPINTNTVVKQIFGGALQSHVKCLPCGAESNKADEIMDLSLEILDSSSVKESMQKFF